MHKSKPRALKIISVIGAIALVAAVGAGGFMLASSTSSGAEQREQISRENEEARWHDVIVSVVAPGLDENGSRIPVRITGADAAGEAYDETAFIKPDGTGLRLQAGKYGIRPIASPLTAQGGMFLYNDANKWFSIAAELEGGEVVDVSESVSLVFEAADPSDLSADAVAAARDYAVKGGMDEATVNGLLENVERSMAQAKQGAAFSNVQTYRGITFVGDVRTNTGFVPAYGIPGTQNILTRTNKFLFTGNTLFYADNSAAADGTQAIALHSRNMSTGQETILATDLASLTTPYYVHGQILYSSTEWGQAVKRIDISSGETTVISDNISGEFTKLVGVKDDKVLVATGDGMLPQLCFAPLGEGEQEVVTYGEEYGNVVGVFNDTVLVSITDWDEMSRIVAYALDGTYLWEGNIEDGVVPGPQYVYQDKCFYALSSGGTRLVYINVETGDVKLFTPGIQYLFGPMAQAEGALYFAGSESYSNYDSTGAATASYTTYTLNLESGEITSVGDYEAPGDEELAAQQDSFTWDNSWSGTGYGYGYDSTGYGYGNGYDSTGTGYGYDATGGTGYGYGYDSTGTGYGYDSTGTGYGYDATGGTGYGYGYSDGTGTGYGYDSTGTGYGYSDGTGYGYGYDSTGTGYGYSDGTGYGYSDGTGYGY